MSEEEIEKLVRVLNESAPFYTQFEFWIATVIGTASVYFSVKAFNEAREAKTAAFEAGKTVKIQTITIELTEIAQRLDKLDFNLSFSEARDLLNEISRRLRRLIAPFQDTTDLSVPCLNLKNALDSAKDALEEVRPQNPEDELPPNTIYFATQGHFSNISGLVAEIMGLFEKRTIEVNDK
ncbi:hypothetical protein [Shewanella algae]|uniref:hypothetical protein n=1 Tax=Shewanella algae TaxID=38313 RepID=UPI001BF021D8|nr:hypothetical protein [Shewanella algae]MDL2195258.1 hypothetical protein [Shewanella algae]BCV50608.1 hypothetical protein TUM17382_33010 [Shewanella algae]